jgi:hypothetical protein
VAGADRMTIEEVVRKVLLDEHADVLREAVRAVAAELMEVALLLRDPGTPARSQRITALRPLELACRSPAARSSRRRPPVRTFSVPAARSTSRARTWAHGPARSSGGATGRATYTHPPTSEMTPGLGRGCAAAQRWRSRRPPRQVQAMPFPGLRPIVNPYGSEVLGACRGGFSDAFPAHVKTNAECGLDGRPGGGLRHGHPVGGVATPACHQMHHACIREVANARAALPRRSPWTTDESQVGLLGRLRWWESLVGRGRRRVKAQTGALGSAARLALLRSD